jgi:GGDEF domain-containing protein
VSVYLRDPDTLDALVDIVSRRWPTAALAEDAELVAATASAPPRVVVTDAEGLPAVRAAVARWASPPVVVCCCALPLFPEGVDEAIPVLLHADGARFLGERIGQALEIAAIGAGEGLWPDEDAGSTERLDARLEAFAAAALAADRAAPVLVATVDDPEAFARTSGWVAAHQLGAWIASEMRDRSAPGDLCARVGSYDCLMLLPGRALAEADALRRELTESFRKARPLLGPVRSAVPVSVHMLDARQGPRRVRDLIVHVRTHEGHPHGA